MGGAGVFEREGRVDDRLDFAAVEQRPDFFTQRRRNRRLGRQGRERRVAPVIVRRLSISSMKSKSLTFAPCRKAICTIRPSGARADRFFCI